MEPQNENQNNPPAQQPPQTFAPSSLPTTPQVPANQTPQPATPNQSSPVNVPAQTQQPKETQHLTEKAEQLKKLSIQVMIGGLIGAAILAVVAVLAGSFNQTFERALFTLFLVIVHVLACLAFVEQTGKPKKSDFKFFENSVFFIIVLSFFTSIFGVWRLLDGDIVAKLYGTYGVLLFASLHGQMLVEARGKQAKIDTIIDVNYVMMGLVILLILPIIWVSSASFPNFYYRLLAACGIIDATLTILAVILHRLYVQKHPESQSAIFSSASDVQASGSQAAAAQSGEHSRHMHPLLLILAIFLIGQFVISILFALMGAFYR